MHPNQPVWKLCWTQLDPFIGWLRHCILNSLICHLRIQTWLNSHCSTPLHSRKTEGPTVSLHPIMEYSLYITLLWLITLCSFGLEPEKPSGCLTAVLDVTYKSPGGSNLTLLIYRETLLKVVINCCTEDTSEQGHRSTLQSPIISLRPDAFDKYYVKNVWKIQT